MKRIKINQYGFLVVVLLCVLYLIGCSSLPKKMEPRSLVFAGMKMRLARVAQQQHDFLHALALYGEAYSYFTSIDDIQGKIAAGLSIARQYFYLEQPAETEKWLNQISTLIESTAPQMVVARELLLIEMAFAKEEFQKVITLAAAIHTGNLEWQMEIRCYAMVAKAKLKQDYKVEFAQVQAGFAELQKRFEKRNLGDAEVLSLGYYYTGYIYSLEEKWPLGLEFFEKARSIDSVMDNSYGLGKDLYSLGRCYEKLGDRKKAISSYNRATEIFILLKDDIMAKKAKERAKSLIN